MGFEIIYLRRFSSGLLLVASVLLAAAAALSFFVADTLIDRDGFVETFDSVGVEDSLVERVAESFNEELIALGGVSPDDIDPAILDAELLGIEIVDDEGEFLDNEAIAESIENRQRSIIRDAVDIAVNDPGFPDEFTRSLDSAHADLAAAIEQDLGTREPVETDGEVHLSLVDTYGAVIAQLEQEPITAGLAAASDVRNGRLKVADRTTTFTRVWSFLERAEPMRSTYAIGAIICFGLAVVLAERRPFTIIAAGVGLVGSAVVLVVIGWVIFGVLPLLTESRVSAALVGSVYRHGLTPLTQLMITLGAVGVGLSVIGWLTRWVWPDDWVYSHYDDGTGGRALARRATRSERRNKQSAAPVHMQYPNGQAPVYQQPQQAHPQYQQNYQQPVHQQQAAQEWAPFDDAQPASPNGAPRRALDPAPADRGRSDTSRDGDWDYDNSGW